MAKKLALRSESMGVGSTYDGHATVIARQFDDQTPDVTLACETVRLDVLASVLRRDAWTAPGGARIPEEERIVLLELMADMASEVRRLAQLTEAYVSATQRPM
ncbi:hypothetical protein [Burkholderia gladioli]|uniref:hypothetical protein n=1 Tax=Burkholderia gladioli TaxID=28095 RepID=UPI0016422BB5|nr:hypothetical protein [Burkholderia gladioli]